MNFVRRGIELLSRGQSFQRTIQVGGEKIKLYVSPDAQLKYMKLGPHAFDQDLIKIAETFLSKHSCVWDVGANVGIFTFAAAAVASAGTIISIEADTWLAELLRKSHRLAGNQSSDVRVVPVAASDVDGVAEFQIASRGRASNALAEAGGSSQMGGVRELQHVPTLRLDTILKAMPRPDFVKIDVEGAELMVLKGATDLVSQARPLFYIEVGKDKFATVDAFFQRRKYTAFDPKGKIADVPDVGNYFFVPEENDYILTKIKALST